MDRALREGSRGPAPGFPREHHEASPPEICEEVLTRREREVAALLARGMTNRQIASELFVSERTAETHARNTLKKLGLRSRAQLAAREMGRS